VTLRLIREPTKDNATMGVLFVDGAFFGFSVEDPIRELPGQPVSHWKVPGETAIPQGRYRIDVTHSQRFNRRLPVLLTVPGFEGVRIHPGNSPLDTEGCLIFGRVRGIGKVFESRLAFEHLFALIEAASDPVWIEIENPRA
jgi:hypothetical protein